MRYRLLGRTGLRVSEVGLGTMTFSDRGLSWGAAPEECAAIFDAFATAGGTYIDTANIYGDGMNGEDGAAERVLADLIARDREHFVVATKYTSSNTTDISRSGNSFKAMRQSLDASLRALGTDHVDVLWLHTWDGTTPVDEVLRGAHQLVTAGKVLYFGLSDTPAWVVSQAVAMAEARGWTPPIAVQCEYSLAERTPEPELLAMAEALDLGVAAWGPLAGGLLTGKYTRDGRDGDGGNGAGAGGGHRYADAHYTGLAGPADDRRLAVARAVDAVAHELGRPSQHVAIAWLRQRPGVVVALLGARTREQIAQNLAGLDLVLSDEHLVRLDRASAPSLGFPHDFLASATVRAYSTSGHAEDLDNHRALHYPAPPAAAAGPAGSEVASTGRSS
jgi:aryl-alcohol dehydrogenase-like predicted oxidoreductase